jgi:hypothetical protein
MFTLKAIILVFLVTLAVWLLWSVGPMHHGTMPTYLR